MELTYSAVQGDDLSKVSVEVTKLMKEGWEPHGSPVIYTGNFSTFPPDVRVIYVQAMTRKLSPLGE